MKALGWKIWAGALAVMGAVLGLLKLRGDWHKAQAEKARTRAVTAEKRYDHKEAVTTADREAAQKGDELVRDAVSKARSGDRTHFE